MRLTKEARGVPATGRQVTIRSLVDAGNNSGGAVDSSHATNADAHVSNAPQKCPSSSATSKNHSVARSQTDYRQLGKQICREPTSRERTIGITADIPLFKRGERFLLVTSE